MKTITYLTVIIIFLSVILFPQTEKTEQQKIRNKTETNFSKILNATTTHFFDINKMRTPVINNGVIADASINNIRGLQYDEGTLVFSGGIILSGYKNNSFWANAIASASRMVDYLPGVFDTINPPVNQLFKVNVNDPPFGTEWQNWINAVNLGADFYDGNKDGIYNPVDLNSNGIWDSNEDRPGLIGNETTFFVYSDKLAPALRRFTNSTPIGIEIRQTTFAFANSDYALNNVLFVKYDILNKSGSDLDSIIFSAWADPDIGLLHSSDYVSTDTMLQTIYLYKTQSDPMYGANPPAIFHSLMQGPVAYIPGITFIDLNNNGVYDHGFDTPLDTAYNIRGRVLGVDTLPGAKNLGFSSSSYYMNSHMILGDPMLLNEIRFLQLGGLTTIGGIIDPCNFSFGTVVGVNCNNINRRFILSGDPVANLGWINTMAADHRTLLNIGPFNLKNNKNNVIILAYVAGRGNSPLNSVTVGKQNLTQIKEAFRRNFPVVLSAENEQDHLPQEYILHQNYPNPFSATGSSASGGNPGTTISWQSAVGSWQTIKLYDVLGREIDTIVDGYYEAGKHSTFYILNSKLPSGVYFYRLQAGNFVETKKMILMR